ncbi:autophagy-related protein 11 [Echria macrotheca]|uniref:Autophagy-related protein 11 n=1 Tax=Echria macrotheca TaxID=438768 RepID=A0AAJ0BFY9_9PEZI|nr:autophagy-related protein 11 [Echria macrotheca]
MATQVLVAHTGQRLEIDASQLTSLDDLKASVANQTSIPTQYIIILTTQNKPLKFQTIQAEKELFVYDGRLTQSPSPTAPLPVKSEIPIPKRYNVAAPPNAIDDTRSVYSWQELFKARRSWTLRILEDCGHMASTTRERYAEMTVMLRCLDAAVANLDAVVRNLEPRHEELKRWAPVAQADYGSLTTGWEQYLSLARSVPVSPAMVRFMTGRDVGTLKGRAQRQSTLEDLVDLETARKAGRLAPGALRRFTGRIADLDKAALRLFQGADDLFREYGTLMAQSALSHEHDAAQLLQDIEAVAKKIETDCQTALEFSNTSRDVLQASKIAATHTERLLPSIRARALEMDEMLRYATQARNSLAAESVEIMRCITDLTSLSTSVKSQINTFTQEDDLATFDYLRLIQQVPYMYATFVAEAVHRREWFEKVKQDSSTLANEMALFQDEEIKRRRKWHKSVGDAYGPDTPSVESRVPGLEVNLLGEDEQWPAMTRADLEEFHNLLKAQKADPGLLNDIGKLIADVSNPTKQQSKRVKAFKNGSIHEAALGRSGLLIRGDDDLLRSLQDDKSKLESKLKTAESRVRRLEDLLHRQTQASRPSIGNLFQAPSQQLTDRNDSTISVRSPRLADDQRKSVDGADNMMHRIQQLEAELQAERERSANLERDLGKRTTLQHNLQGQMEEANSTKKDLMENMEALKREFVEERRSLEDEIKRLQTRLEDTEDEIEHFGESRENEKATYNEKLRTLELEVERLVKEKQDDALKSDGQVEFLRKEARLQRDRVEAQERQLQSAQEEAKNLAKKLSVVTERAEMSVGALQSLWGRMSQDEDAPEDLVDLIEGVSVRFADALAKVRSYEGDMALLRMDIDSAQSVAKALRTELAAKKESLSSEEMVSIRLREVVSEFRAKVAALEGELVDGREQLSQLRTRLADGETGSDSLRKRLEEEEEKLASVTEELASRQSQVGNLEEEVRLYRDRLEEARLKLSDLSLRLDSRTGRAKDLTQRLYSQNERLTRLLERLGFSVTRQGSSMIIQKVPRAERSAQNPGDSDPGSSVRRSGTLSSRVITDSADLELLYWMDGADADAESAKYEAYLASLGSFDTDGFSETVYRRVRDVEYMARKLQRDAKAYREKAHSLQKEAHDKIAFKHFKEGDLCLFLPTRNQTNGAWAAFNVGFPHYFLREQETHKLGTRDWLLARISRVQERVVDLSKSLQQQPNTPSRRLTGPDADSLNDEENDNPFDLSDGLRWYLIDAVEDKAGAPHGPRPPTATVAATNVEAMADMRAHGRSAAKGSSGRAGASSGIDGVSKTLSKSLESRRSSTGSRKALPFTIAAARGRESALASETNSLRAAPADTPAATSPTQHATPHSTSPQTHTPAIKPPSGSDKGEQASADRLGLQPSQPGTEVRNEIDSLMGP